MQAKILKTFTERLPTFPDLAGDQATIKSLEAVDSELMWTLLDYSTVSRSSQGDSHHNGWAPANHSIDNSWSDLFIDFNMIEDESNWPLNGNMIEIFSRSNGPVS